MSTAWYLYVVRCADDSVYCGIAVDVDARVAKHNAGTGARYTRARRPVEVVFKRRCATPTRARRLEGLFKQLTRADKLAVVGGDAKTWRALLAECRRRERK